MVKGLLVRRAQLIDCAQALFLAKGYERTTVNDVIQATSLSKERLLPPLRLGEDLLEAIAARFPPARRSPTQRPFKPDQRPTALQRLNTLLATARQWKAENLADLRAMFTVLLRPENAPLYHRIVGAVFAAMGPKLVEIIADGQADGTFQRHRRGPGGRNRCSASAKGGAWSVD